MTSNKLRALDDQTFDAALRAATGPVLVDFTAAWCGPCKVQSKILERLAPELNGVLIATVDVDASPELTSRFGVRGMPTLLAFSNEREIGRRLGLSSESAIRALLAHETATAERAPATQPTSSAPPSHA